MKHISLLCASLLTTMSAFCQTADNIPVFTGMVEKTIPANKKQGSFSVSARPAPEYMKIAEMSRNYNSAMRSPGQPCTVSITIDIDDMPECEQFGFYKLCIFNDLLYTRFNPRQQQLENNKTWKVQVPPGTYDIFCGLMLMTNTGDKTKQPNVKTVLIAHEDVTITADGEHVFKTSEANRKVIFDKYLPDGTKAVYPTLTASGDLDYTNATASGANHDQSFFHKDVGELASSSLMVDYEIGDTRSVWLSKMSDDYTFYEAAHIIGIDGQNLYLTAKMVSGDVSTTLKNDPTKYVKKDADKFHHSPSRSEEPENKHSDSFSVGTWVKNTTQGMMYTYNINPREAGKVWVCADADFDLPHAEPVIYEESSQYREWGYVCKTVAPGARYNGERWEYVNCNGGAPYAEGPTNLTEGYRIIATNGLWKTMYPGHSEFSYFRGDTPVEFGNSCPMSYTHLEEISMSVDNNDIVKQIPFNSYIGRMGECRIADIMKASYSFKYNGEEVFNPSYGTDLAGWYRDEYYPDHKPGLVSITTTNNNILVDDMKGCNTTTVNYDERLKEVLKIPTMTMLVFKNRQGEITDRFASAGDGRIELSAASFSKSNYAQTCHKPSVVTVEYAPMGTASWHKINVEEIPELYRMPNFGHFYRGSLEEVDLPTANGWYDLKVTVADPNGNNQVQTISPAFRIDENAGTDRIDADNATAPAEYYTLQGIRVENPTGGVFLRRQGADVSKVIIK